MKVNLKPRSMMYPAPAVVASAYDEEGNADACTLAFATMFASSSCSDDCLEQPRLIEGEDS